MKIDGYGLSVDVPQGWYGRIYQREAGPEEVTKPIVHLANAPLSDANADDVLQGTMEAMGRDGVAVAVYELEPLPGFANPELGFGDAGAAIGVRPGDTAHIQGVPSEFLTLLRRVRFANRYFQIRVVFGASQARPELFAQVNRILGSFRAANAAVAG
jgi:hypothetical protein